MSVVFSQTYLKLEQVFEQQPAFGLLNIMNRSRLMELAVGLLFRNQTEFLAEVFIQGIHYRRYLSRFFDGLLQVVFRSCF